MDLSFSRFEADGQIVALPPDLAVLMVGVAARQAASPTAMVQASLPHRDQREPFAPAHGSFNLAVWEMLGIAPVDERHQPAVYSDGVTEVHVRPVSAAVPEMQAGPPPRDEVLEE